MVSEPGVLDFELRPDINSAVGQRDPTWYVIGEILKSNKNISHLFYITCVFMIGLT
jgi:hypothetical protein